MECRRHEPLTRWALGKLLQWKPCGSWKPAPSSADFSKTCYIRPVRPHLLVTSVVSPRALTTLALAWFVLEGFEGRLWVYLINQFRQVEIRNVFYLSWLFLLSKRFFIECLPCWFQVEDSRSPSNAWEGLCASGPALFFTLWQLWCMEVPIEETTKKATSGLLHETSRRSLYVDKACNKAVLFSTRVFFLHCFRFTF